MTIKVLAVTSEIYPLIKTGGLADVAGALPLALRAKNVATTTLVPGYPAVMGAIGEAAPVLTFSNLFGGSARVLRAQAAGLELLALEAPHLFGRPGNLYMGPDGRDWADNVFRFGGLAWVATQIALGEVKGYTPDVVHGHDWQAGLAIAYLSYSQRPRPATVLTVHNLAFQGRFPAALLERLKLPPDSYSVEGVEHYGDIGFLKAGLQFADHITTVSPTYAQEIQMPEGGCGLDGLLRFRHEHLSGIRNGIDVDVWDPETDSRIASRFNATTLPARTPNKAAVRQRFELAGDASGPLFAVVSRMAWQKGLDLLAECVPALVAQGSQLAVLGTGEQDLENRFKELKRAYRGQVGCIIGYDEDLAHLMQAGADGILVPSRFEPCGLTQLCAMRYGAVPIGTNVGGLADTIVDGGPTNTAVDGTTGLLIPAVTREAIENTLRRAAALWAKPSDWQQLQVNGMRTDVSWTEPADEYFKLYSRLVASKI